MVMDLSILTGYKVLEEAESKLNGKLTVVKDIVWGTHIKGGGLTQSGGVATKVLGSAVDHAKRKGLAPKSSLILGLGGGSLARLIRDSWPKTKITGVDMDEVIVGLGIRHLGLKETGANVVIKDASRFVSDQIKAKEKYDLIGVDMYVQDSVPQKFRKAKFIKNIKKLLKKGGLVFFNRLYYGEKRKEAHDFEKLLKKEFEKVDTVYPEANIIFLCERPL